MGGLAVFIVCLLMGEISTVKRTNFGVEILMAFWDLALPLCMKYHIMTSHNLADNQRLSVQKLLEENQQLESFI